MINIGEISFLNSLPLSLTIEDEAQVAFLSKHPSKIIAAPPRVLNQKMAEGKLDISPVSSVFYLKSKSQFELITHCCIASDGPVESVLWFRSKNASLQLDTVWVPDTSETSIVLLKWLMEVHGVTAKKLEVYKKGNAAKLLIEKDITLLSIGDEALMLSAACHEDHPFNKRYMVTDVASEWREKMERPCVFANWVAQNDFLKKAEASIVIADLAKYYQDRLAKFENDFLFQQHVIKLANKKYPALCTALGEDAVQHYLLNALSYDFGVPEQESLKKLEMVYKDIENKQLQGIA